MFNVATGSGQIATELFRHLYSLSGNREASIADAVSLATLRVARHLDIIATDESPPSELFPGEFADNSIFADETRRLVDSFPSDELTARLPGEIYEILQETTALPARKKQKQTLREQRRGEGLFFTPESVIRQIVDLALPEAALPGSICDPAMGSGHFLLGVVARLDKELSISQLRSFVSTSLFGLDINPDSPLLVRRALWLSLSRPKDSWLPPEENFRCNDALLAPEWDGKPAAGFDCIIGNPPYDVLTGFSRNPEAREYAGRIRNSEFYSLSLKGQINLYRCFIERSLSQLKERGVLSLVVPASLLTDSVAAPLRKALIQEHNLDTLQISQESEKKFKGITQAVVIFRCHKSGGESASISVEAEATASVTPNQLGRLSDEMPVPLAGKLDWELINWLQTNATGRFADIAKGFVGEVDQTVYREFMKDEPTSTVLIRGCHLQPFLADITPEPGKQRFLDEKGFLEKKGSAAARCIERVESPRVIQLGIRNMESRPRLIAATIPAGIYLGNSVNFWLPRHNHSVDFIAGLLNSRLYDWRFRLTSGNNNINLREITPLPLPESIRFQDAEKIADACRLCVKAAAKGDRLPLAALNDAVAEFFGLPKRLREYLSKGTGR